LDRRPKEEIPYYFAPGKRLLQIVVQLPEKHGVLGEVLSQLEKKVRLVGTTTYRLPDGTVMVSVVAETQSEEETPERIGRLLKSAGALDSEVFEGTDGILVDTFHSGLATGAEYLVQFRRLAVTRLIDRIHMLLGSGADVLLFEGGASLGRSNAEELVRSLGAGTVRKTVDYLMKGLAAQGLGTVTRKGATGDEGSTLVVRDCFECSSNESKRTGCNFFRGYLVGSSSAVAGGEFTVEETRCRLTGGEACEFRIEPKSKPTVRGVGLR